MQPDLFSRMPKHDGPFLKDPEDHVRLGRQLLRVLGVLQSGEWLTLRQLSQLAEAPEASCSARLRDLRKEKFGAHEIDHKRIANTWHYRLKV